MKTVMFIHQSSELYGSDKTLFELVLGFKNRGHRVIVVLPENGPLKELFDRYQISVILAPVIKVSRKMFSPANLFSLPSHGFHALRHIRKMLAAETPELVYSNTLAVLAGICYARRYSTRHIWHVHEIIERPKIIKWFFVRLLKLKTNSQIIYNSDATRRFWEKGNLLHFKGVVVRNGIEGPAQKPNREQVIQLRRDLFGAGQDDIVVVLVGRINRWKGQMLLLDALLPDLRSDKNLRLVFVGSEPPKQPFYLNNLRNRVSELQLNDQVRILSFRDNVWPIWYSSDIAVVPSTEPEPFGLVAVEAMLCERPVVAADHGGLSEIVQHEVTGLLVPPNDAAELRSALRHLIRNPNLRERYGKAGYARACENFGSTRYVDEIEKICENKLTTKK